MTKEFQEILNELKHGANFQRLAQIKSLCPSGKTGGDLGWFNAKQMVKEFSDAAFALKKGEFTKTPVKTQFGYHVIFVEDKKNKEKVKNFPFFLAHNRKASLGSLINYDLTHPVIYKNIVLIQRCVPFSLKFVDFYFAKCNAHYLFSFN